MRVLNKKSSFEINYFIYLFIIFFFVHLYFSLIGWNNSILDLYGSRQSQTAITTYYTIKEGFRLDYITPVLGKPWSIPMEFPLYQWIVALFVKITKYNLDQAGRLVSLTFFYLSLIPAYFLISDYIKNKGHRFIVLSLILANPIYIFWSRTFMIESLALFLGLTYLCIGRIALKRGSNGWLFLVAIFGILAALTKATTFVVFCIPLAFFFIFILLDELRSKRFLEILTKYVIYGLVMFIVPLLIAIIWISYGDYLKSQNPMADFIISTNLNDFNFGTFQQKLSLHTWQQIISYTFPTKIPNRIVLVFLWIVGLILNRKYRKEILFPLLFSLSGPLIFTNLYYVHSYYYYANSIFISISFGFVLISLIEFNFNKKTQLIQSYIIVPIILLFYLGYIGSNYYTLQVSNNIELGYTGSNYSNTELISLANVIKNNTHDDEVLLIYGQDWDSSLPYYSQRKSLMDRYDLSPSDQRIQSALSKLNDSRITAMVVNSRRDDSKFIKERVDYFHFNPDPVYKDRFGDLYILATASGSPISN